MPHTTHAHMNSTPNLLPLHAVLFSDTCSVKKKRKGNDNRASPALCRSSGPSRNLGADLNSRLWAVLCGVSGPFPASSGGRWTGSCPEISAHLVRRSKPPVKAGPLVGVSPIRTVYRATGASGWGRRWLHTLHVHLYISLRQEHSNSCVRTAS